MFIKYSTGKDFNITRSKLYFDLNEYVIETISKKKIKKLQIGLNNPKGFDLYKRWILFKWINNNIEFSNKFLNNLKKIIKKIDICLNEKEEKFIREIEELVYFRTKPLKRIQTNIKLDKNEYVYFHRKDVIIHILQDNNINQLGQFDLLFTNKKIFIVDTNFKIKLKLTYESITSIEQKYQGILLVSNNVIYLLREANKLVIYQILKRLISNIEIKDLYNIYSYFDLLNNIVEKNIF